RLAAVTAAQRRRVRPARPGLRFRSGTAGASGRAGPTAGRVHARRHGGVRGRANGLIAMTEERDIAVTAADGTRLLIDPHAPQAAADQPGTGLVVWIRTPYGRKGIESITRRFAKAGAHVLVEAVRGTDGSGGEFDPFSVTPADAAAV